MHEDSILGMEKSKELLHLHILLRLFMMRISDIALLYDSCEFQ
jgi:hypothetical protein